MAQEPNEMNPSRSETDAIRGEIERTRVEMRETIDEIQDRLRPGHILQQAKVGVREAATGKVKNIMHSASETAYDAALRARDAGNHLAWYAREHPIRIAITAGVVTWWMLRGRNRPQDWYGASDTSWEQDDYEPLEPMRPSLGERAGDLTANARQAVSEYASTARETAGEYAASARETAGEYAASARDTVNQYAESAGSAARSASYRVRRAASTATTSVDDWVHGNPLAAGAVAVAIGAAIGLAIPATEYEDRAMGETRDQAVARARDVANNLKQNVGEKVAAYAENVVDESLMGASAAAEPLGRA